MAKRRRSRRTATKCHIKSIRVRGRGTRFMLICPNKPAKFISAARAKGFRKPRRRRARR